MNQLIDKITSINGAVNSFVWGPIMLVVFLAVGLMFTVRTGFFQVTKFKLWMDETFLACFKKKNVIKTEDKKAISQFQALTTALAATIGTGNIAGVATAIATGGPGAVFWMWLSAFLGMMTNFAENTLGIKYRYKNEKGDWVGGAMVYIERGLGKNWKWLAIIFSCFCVLASFGIGNMSQANSIATALRDSFGVPVIATGIVIMVFVALVIMGGIKRIASVTEKIVPFMAGIYILGAIVIIAMNITSVPAAFGLIFKEAFNFKAMGGGVLGYGIMLAMRKGISRGVFSNEAGLGSSVMVHSSSDVKEPVVQGMWGVFEVFADTLVVCTMTALVILTSGAYNQDNYMEYYLDQSSIISEQLSVANTNIGNANSVEDIIAQTTISIDDYIVACDTDSTDKVKLYQGANHIESIISSATSKIKKEFPDDLNAAKEDLTKIYDDAVARIDEDVAVPNGVPLTSKAFSSAFGKWGGKFVSIAIMMFAFSTILGWSFYGSRAVEYLFGLKAVPIYKIVFIAVILIGCVSSLDLVWDISDTFNGLMAIPNLLAVTLLSGKVISIVKDYFAGKEFVPDSNFDPHADRKGKKDNSK